MNIKILGFASLLGLTAILGACAPASNDGEPTVEEKTEEVEKSVDDTLKEAGEAVKDKAAEGADAVKEAGEAVKDKAAEGVDAVKEGVENLQEKPETEAKEEAN